MLWNTIKGNSLELGSFKLLLQFSHVGRRLPIYGKEKHENRWKKKKKTLENFLYKFFFSTADSEFQAMAYIDLE